MPESNLPRRSIIFGRKKFYDTGTQMYNTVVTKHMKLGGRVCVFGNLSLYNNGASVDLVQGPML